MALKISSNAIKNLDSVILLGAAISSIKVNLPDSTNIGQNINLIVTPPSGFIFTLTKFFYRKSGDINYQQANLILSGGLYIADIPASFSTISGIQSYIIFSDGESTITYPTNDPINNPASIEVEISQINYPLDMGKSVYKMISIPL